MSKALYILEASLHDIMTVPKTYKDYSRNSSVQLDTIHMWNDSGIMTDVKLQLLMTIVFFFQCYSTQQKHGLYINRMKKTSCI